MKRQTVHVSMLLCFLLIMALPVPALSAEGDTVTLKYTNFFPPVHPISALSEEWCKAVEKGTQGRVKVNFYPGNSLTRPTETYDAVLKGIADVGLSFCAYTRGRFPLSQVVDLPLGYKNATTATRMANAYYKKFKPKEFDDVKVVYLHASPPHRLFTNKEVKKLEDVKGLKIRSTGTSAKVVNALGGVAVAMPMSAAYDALKKGVAEGIVGPFEPMVGFKLIDVVSNCTLFDAAYTNLAYVVMNKEKWNNLSPEDKKTIDQINEQFMEKQAKLWDTLEANARGVYEKKGKKIITLSPEENERWTKLLIPIRDEYQKAMAEKGLPGKEALEFCLNYLKDHQK